MSGLESRARRIKESKVIKPDQLELAGFEAVVKDPFALVMTARQGVSAAVAFAVAGVLQIHADQLADLLHVTTKTLQSYRQANKKLNASLSEQTLKLLALYLQGNKIFGEVDSFRRWLHKPAYGLDEQIPLALLETSGGIDLVTEELERIAYGDLA